MPWGVTLPAISCTQPWSAGWAMMEKHNKILAEGVVSAPFLPSGDQGRKGGFAHSIGQFIQNAHRLYNALDRLQSFQQAAGKLEFAVFCLCNPLIIKICFWANSNCMDDFSFPPGLVFRTAE
jgi:hypothetical protein